MNILRIQALAFLFFFPLLSQAQNAIEPYIGYSIDLNNKQPLSQVNIGLQYPFIRKPIYQMLIGVRAGFPLNKRTGADEAYTFDQDLPLSINTGYETKLYSYAFIMGHRLKVVSWGDKNIISAFINVGVVYQHTAVVHSNYNMDKYTILNPHRELKKTGVFMGGGIQYKRKAGSGYTFVQLEVASPPIVESINNYHYKAAVPLALNLGYAFEFKKRAK